MALHKILKNIGMNWQRKNDELFIELLDHNPKARAIDLGCGEGKFTMQIWKKIGCEVMEGMEQWEEGIKDCLKCGIKINKNDLNQKFNLESEIYDVVTNNQVIEHLLYPTKFLEEIHRILKPGGYCIISTENLASWDNIFALLLGRTPFSVQLDSSLKIGNPFSPLDENVKFQENLDLYAPHVRIFSFYTLYDLLKNIGFKILAVKTAGHILNMNKLDKRHCRYMTFKAQKV